MDNPERLLAKVPFFADLPSAELHRLATNLETCQCAPGDVLFREGERGDSFYIVRQGQIEVVKNLGTAEERLLATRGAGEFVGEMSLMRQDGLRTASVRAASQTELWGLSRADFDALLQRQPFLAYEMVRVLGSRLNEAHNRAIGELTEKNQQLQLAYEQLKAAQAQIIEKERLERELEVARQIQMGILPEHMPSMDGYDFGARISSARSVGGDFFDFIPLYDGSLAVMIGDVTDKGVPAAIFMAQVHAFLRSEAGRGLSPGGVLLNVNQHLMEMNAHGLFATVLYGILDPKNSRFIYARAGHELPLLRMADGMIKLAVQGVGQPVGILDDPVVDEQVLEIPPGSTLLLYTDGITDERNPQGERYGMARFQKDVRSLPDGTAQEVCDRILGVVLDYLQGAPQDDDVTVVALLRR